MLKLAKGLLGVHYFGLMSFAVSVCYLFGQKADQSDSQKLFQTPETDRITNKNQSKIIVFTRIFHSVDGQHTLDNGVKMVRRQFKVIS